MNLLTLGTTFVLISSVKLFFLFLELILELFGWKKGIVTSVLLGQLLCQFLVSNFFFVLGLMERGDSYFLVAKGQLLCQTFFFLFFGIYGMVPLELSTAVTHYRGAFVKICLFFFVFKTFGKRG